MPYKAPTAEQSLIAELVAREGISEREAVTKLGLAFSSEDISNLKRSKVYQQLLRGCRNRFYREIAVDPEWNKNAAMGQMLYLTQRLIEEGQFDKAGELLLKVAKIAGWLGPDTALTVVGAMSHNDLEEAKQRIREQIGGSKPN